MRVYLETPNHRYRLHHGLVGVATVVVGLGLMLHDWRDRPWGWTEVAK